MLLSEDRTNKNSIVSWCHDQAAYAGRGLTINQVIMAVF